MSVEFDNMTKKLNDIRMMDRGDGIYDIRSYVFPCGKSRRIKPLLVVTYRTKTSIYVDGCKEAIFFIEEDTGAPMVMQKGMSDAFYVDHDTFSDLNRIFNKFKDVWDEYLASKAPKDPDYEWRIRLFNDEDLTDEEDDEYNDDDDEDDDLTDEDEDEDEDLTDDDEEETEQTKVYVVSSKDRECHSAIWGAFSTKEKAIEFKKNLEYLFFESPDEEVGIFEFVIDEPGLDVIETQKKRKFVKSLMNDEL